MKHTKSEQSVYDRVKAQNDLGQPHFREPVEQVGGQKSNWRGRGYRTGHPNKLEQKALATLLERGVILCLDPANNRRYVITGHTVLQVIAAEKAGNLLRQAREVEERRVAYEQAERHLEEMQAFVRKYGTD
jgi:hypothetical protein